MSPTHEEEILRRQVVESYRQIVTFLFPAATLEVFGSTATKLYLPVSDIDLVMFVEGGDAKEQLRRVAIELQRRELVSFIELILTAKVPIVKFVDKRTSVSEPPVSRPPLPDSLPTPHMHFVV